MSVRFEPATSTLSGQYIRIRGLTRENAATEDRLRQLGVTAKTWAAEIDTGELWGTNAIVDGRLAGYCFGDTRTGEVVVLALLPEAEGKGIGRQLLASVVARLKGLGHTRLFLGCSSDPGVRSYGFYRHLGWRSTGSVDHRNDEILELVLE